jgi:hypothetical protein
MDAYYVIETETAQVVDFILEETLPPQWSPAFYSVIKGTEYHSQHLIIEGIPPPFIYKK